MKLTDEQQRIINEIPRLMENGGNLIIPSTAGSGKTFILRRIAEEINSEYGLPVLYSVFGAANEDEAKPKFAEINTENEVLTTHKLGLAVLKSNGKRFTINNGHLYAIAKKEEHLAIADMRLGKNKASVNKDLNKLKQMAFFSGIKPIIERAMSNGIGPDNILEEFENIVETYTIAFQGRDPKTVAAVRQMTLDYIQDIYYAYLESDFHLDFNKMLWIPATSNLVLNNARIGAVLVDEVQDFNWMQIQLFKNCIEPLRLPIIFVGDDEQAIYGWRGAMKNSMELIKEQFNCKEMTLSTTFRCSVSVTSYSSQFSSRIRPRIDAPEGIVEKGIKRDEFLEKAATLNSDSLIICRKNAPLFEVAYKLLREGIPAKIIGRDVSAELVQFIRNQICLKKTLPLDQFISRLSKWAEDARQNMTANGFDNTEVIDDKYSSIVVFCDGVQNTDELCERIETVFTDNAMENCVRLSTIHRAKGLEAKSVYWLEVKPFSGEQKDWQKIEERCCKFVASTRAIETLSIVNFEKIED